MLIKNAKIAWAKIIGKPRPNKFNPEGEWSFDLSVTDELRKALKDHGMSNKIKNNDDERGDYVTFRKKGVLKDGGEAKPIPVIDHHNNPWDGRLIGNGSVVNVSLLFEEYGDGNKKKFSVKPMAIQIWDLVAFKRNDFPTKDDETGEVTAAAKEW